MGAESKSRSAVVGVLRRPDDWSATPPIVRIYSSSPKFLAVPLFCSRQADLKRDPCRSGALRHGWVACLKATGRIAFSRLRCLGERLNAYSAGSNLTKNTQPGFSYSARGTQRASSLPFVIRMQHFPSISLGDPPNPPGFGVVASKNR